MTNKVSELMDGELDSKEAADIIKQLKKKDSSYGNWETYHLIGDALRQQSALSIDISQRINDQLQSEPAILAPSTFDKQSSPHKQKKYTFSIAASIAVILAGWLSLQTLDEPTPIIVVDNHMDNTLPMISHTSSSSIPMLVNTLAPAEFNDYLFVHGEFAPGTATRGPSVYLHQVTNHQDRY